MIKMISILSALFKQTNCVLESTCLNWLTDGNPLGALSLFKEFYGIPNAVTLGLLLGIITGMIYVHQRSLVQLAVIGIYIIALVGGTFAAEAYVAPQYHNLLYVILLGISSAVIIFIVRLIRE